MRYETVQNLKDEEFKRSTGVSRAMFEKMLVVVKNGLRDFGRTPKLNREDQLLMTLMYWREYRTEFHVAQKRVFRFTTSGNSRTSKNATKDDLTRPNGRSGRWKSGKRPWWYVENATGKYMPDLR